MARNKVNLLQVTFDNVFSIITVGFALIVLFYMFAFVIPSLRRQSEAVNSLLDVIDLTYKDEFLGTPCTRNKEGYMTSINGVPVMRDEKGEIISIGGTKFVRDEHGRIVLISHEKYW